MGTGCNFQINHFQCPLPPNPNENPNGAFIDRLRWCLIVADTDDPNLPYLSAALAERIEIYDQFGTDFIEDQDPLGESVLGTNCIGAEDISWMFGSILEKYRNNALDCQRNQIADLRRLGIAIELPRFDVIDGGRA